jgi:hypothetical protein
MRNAYIILVGKPEGKKPPERTRHRLVDNTEMVLKEIDFEGVNWVHLP